MNPRIDPNDLALFAHVVDAGSFTAAAERLGQPKSTVSRRLSGLEAALGERLLQRSTRRLVLTDFGAGVLAHARQVVSETDSAMALAQFRQERPSGHLRVSMPADIALMALREVLADFVRAHPAITLELDLSPRRVDLLAENYDLALRMGRLQAESALSARRLALFSGGLYASPAWVARHGLPSHPDQLLAPEAQVHALVLGRPGTEPSPWRLNRCSEVDPPLREPTETDRPHWQGLPGRYTLANSPVVLIHLAQAGLGVAEVSELVAHEAVRDGQLQRLLPGWQMPPVPAWAVFPERRLMPARTRALLEVLSDGLRACRATSPALLPGGGS